MKRSILLSVSVSVCFFAALACDRDHKSSKSNPPVEELAPKAADEAPAEPAKTESSPTAEAQPAKTESSPTAEAQPAKTESSPTAEAQPAKTESSPTPSPAAEPVAQPQAPAPVSNPAPVNISGSFACDYNILSSHSCTVYSWSTQSEKNVADSTKSSCQNNSYVTIVDQCPKTSAVGACEGKLSGSLTYQVWYYAPSTTETVKQTCQLMNLKFIAVN